MAIPSELTTIPEELQKLFEQYSPKVPHMEWGNFSTPNNNVYRVTFKTPFLKAPSVICVGSTRTGTLTPPKYSAPKITLPTVPTFAKPTLPKIPTFAKITLPALPDFQNISLPSFEIPRVATPNLADTLYTSFRDAANAQIPDWFGYLGIPFTDFNLKTAMVVVFGIVGAMVGKALDTFWIGRFQDQIDQIRDKLNEGISTIRNNIQNTINTYGKNLSTSVNTLRNNTQTVMDNFNTNINTVLNNYNTNVQAVINQFSSNLNTLMNNYNTTLQASMNNLNTQVQDSINNALAAIYKMLGVPAGILATPVALKDVTVAYFDIVGVEDASFWWFAVENV